MVKRKILIITAILAVMVAMTGNAAARSVAGLVYVDGSSNTIPIAGADVSAFNVASPYQQLGSTVTSDLDGSFVIDVGTYSNSQIRVDATKNGKTGTTTGPWISLISLYIANPSVPIPEFPTVAAPIAAVLGLVFFFQQRKNKKE